MSDSGEPSSKRFMEDDAGNDSSICCLATNAKQENSSVHPTGHESRFKELSQDATKEKQTIVEHSVVWKNLPLEMSGVVLDHGDPISVIHFRLVCKDWAKDDKINNRNRHPLGTPAV